MRKGLPLLLVLLLLCPLAGGADTVLFPYEGIVFEAQDNLRLLTQYNVEQYADYLSGIGISPAELLAFMQQNRVVFVAYPTAGNPVRLSVGPVQSGSPQSLALMDEDQRQAYLSAFAQQPLYEETAFSESHPAWVRTTFSVLGESPVYTLRHVTWAHHRQYTLDLDSDQPLSEDDAQVVERVLARLSFLSEAAPLDEGSRMPEATPVPQPTPEPPSAEAAVLAKELPLSVDPFPKELTQPQLTLTGTTTPGAQVQLSSGEALLAQATADAGGLFALALTFPEAGSYSLTLSATLEEALSEMAYTVTFTQSEVPLAVTDPAEPVYGDETTLRGETLPGAAVTLRGPSGSLNLKANGEGAFAFQVRSDKEEGIEYTLTAELEGYLPAETTHTVVRGQTDREALAAFRFALTEIPYKKLVEDPQSHTGKHVTYRGRVMRIEEQDGMPCLLLYTANPAKGVWQEPLWIRLNEIFPVELEEMLTVFAVVTGGQRLWIDEEGQEQSLPVLSLAFWQT